MTRADLLAILYERLNYQSSPASGVTTRLGNALNEAQRRILREPGMSRLRTTTTGLTFASVNTLTIYGLPAPLTKIRSITDRTNDRALEAMSVDDLRLTDPGLDSSGTSWGYVPLGFKPYSRVPVSTGLWVASSSGADTTQTLTLEGVRDTGVATGEITAALNGATRVQIGTPTDISDVVTMTLSAVAAGVVTIYDAAAAGNTISQIAIGKTYPQFFCIQLYPTPTAAITYYVDGAIAVPDMDDATDTPVLPEEFHDLLIEGALMIEWGQKRDDAERLSLIAPRYKHGLSQLKAWLAQQGDLPIMGASARRGYSRLGAWTPAGSGF